MKTEFYTSPTTDTEITAILSDLAKLKEVDENDYQLCLKYLKQVLK